MIVALAAVLYSLRPVSDSDFWHHLAFGRVLVEEGVFPRTDLLGSTSEGRPWVSSGWLPATVLYLAYRAAPEVGPALFVSTVVVLSGLLLLIVGVRRTKAPALAVLVTVLALGASHPRFLPRPDLLSQLMLPLLIMMLQGLSLVRAEGQRPKWLALAAIPFLFLVWANLHMLFMVGLAVLGVYLVTELWMTRKDLGWRQWDLVAVAGASAAACMISPNGWRAGWFVLENARLDRVGERINELKPFLTIIGEPGAGVLFSLLAAWLAGIVYLVRHGRRVGAAADLRLMAVAALLVIIGLMQRRQIGLVVPALTMLAFFTIPTDSGPVRSGGRRRAALFPPFCYGRSPLGISAAVLVGMYGFLVTGGALPSPLRSEKLTGVNCQWFPCEAVDFLQKNPPPGRLFHDLYTGSFLAYQLHPETRVFIDGRLEVYNHGVFDDFFAPPEGRMDVLQLFDKYDVNSALLDWRDAHMQPGSTASLLAGHDGWRLCWFSDHYALFVRVEETNGEYLQAHGYEFLNPLLPGRFMAALESPGERPVAVAEAVRALQDNPTSSLAQKAADFAGVTPAQ